MLWGLFIFQKNIFKEHLRKYLDLEATCFLEFMTLNVKIFYTLKIDLNSGRIKRWLVSHWK